MVMKLRHLVASPKQKPEQNKKSQWRNTTRMRREERDGWGNLGNSKSGPDDRSCRDLAPTVMRTWEGWERTGARWTQKQWGE